MSEERLLRIQRLQFTDKYAAETQLLSFLQDTLPLDVVSVELRPMAVSLNSFNGFLKLRDGKQLFFKTHTETDTVIDEYYQATTLAEAGYPMIQPIYSSTEIGKQVLIYEVIDDPSVFDVAWDFENSAQTVATDRWQKLIKAQHKADDRLLRLYFETLAYQSGEEAARAPIHQLFYHRLTGGRLARFYGSSSGESGEDVTVTLPGGRYSMRIVRQARWKINGSEYRDTLDNIIARSIILLNPSRSGPAIVGHGDAHNGNVFFRAQADSPFLQYFDPAFAGRHHPLLDLTKPLFHNVFAMWMYYPQEIREKTPIAFCQKDNVWQVEYDYGLHSARTLFLTSKVERVLVPILRELSQRNWLRKDWRAYLKAALFCCPMLTMNLTDSVKFPPEISLLGLAMAVEMGAESIQVRCHIDRILDEVETLLH